MKDQLKSNRTLPGRFADMGHLQEQEEIDGKTQKFTGNGTEYLIVPGLLSLESLRIGTVQIPLNETRHYPKDPAGRVLEEVDEPMIHLGQAPDGRPVLLRSTLSNNGIWQKGAQIYVTGEWESKGDTDKNPKTPSASKTAKKAEDTGGADHEPVDGKGDDKTVDSDTGDATVGDNSVGDANSAEDSGEDTGDDAAPMAESVVGTSPQAPKKTTKRGPHIV